MTTLTTLFIASGVAILVLWTTRAKTSMSLEQWHKEMERQKVGPRQKVKRGKR